MYIRLQFIIFVSRYTESWFLFQFSSETSLLVLAVSNRNTRQRCYGWSRFRYSNAIHVWQVLCTYSVQIPKPSARSIHRQCYFKTKIIHILSSISLLPKITYSIYNNIHGSLIRKQTRLGNLGNQSLTTVALQYRYNNDNCKLVTSLIRIIRNLLIILGTRQYNTQICLDIEILVSVSSVCMLIYIFYVSSRMHSQIVFSRIFPAVNDQMCHVVKEVVNGTGTSRLVADLAPSCDERRSRRLGATHSLLF